MGLLDPVVLTNQFVSLEPLGLKHCGDLAEAVAVGELWRVWYTQVPSPEDMADDIARRRRLHEEGVSIPWAVIDAASGRAVGVTTYLNPDPANRRVEIGSTWLGRRAQGTKINPAAKLLLLSRAFEDLACLGVEFRAHSHNRQSRAAIERLGAKQDGLLRRHKILANGTVRDTVVYSIIDVEWPTVRLGLRERLGLT